MKTFTLEEIEEVIKTKCIEHEFEIPCKAWGCVTPHYRKFIDPNELLYSLRNILQESGQLNGTL